MAYQGMYAANGSWNVRVVDGLTYVGRYAADGCLNVTGSDQGNPVGINHPSGALAITSAPVGPNRQAPNGSLNIQSTDPNAAAQYVTFTL